MCRDIPETSAVSIQGLGEDLSETPLAASVENDELLMDPCLNGQLGVQCSNPLLVHDFRELCYPIYGGLPLLP